MSSSLDQITENPDRSQAILKIVWAARAEGDVTYEAVAAKASAIHESFGDLSQEEYDCAVQMVEQSAAAEPEAPTMTRDQAQARKKELEENLFAARKSRMVAEAEQRKAREAMAQAITAWSVGGPTADQITRNELAAINRDRGRKVERGSRPGPSYWDRFASATGHNGDANDFARGRHTHGGNRPGRFSIERTRSKSRGAKRAVAMIRSRENLAKFLDGLMGGLTVNEAMATIDGFPTHGSCWAWRHASELAEAAGLTDSDFFFAYPSNTAPDWFHNHHAAVYERRAQIFNSGQWRAFQRGRFPVLDGRANFQHDDFGQIVQDDLGMPVFEVIEKVEPRQRRLWKARREGLLDPPRSRIGRPRLNSNGSLREHQPAQPVIINPPSAIAEYIQATNPKTMTPLEQDLRDRLAAGPTNPKPSHPVKVIRDEADDAKRERASQPSNQTGLPTQAADRPARVAPQVKPAIDYSRGKRA